MGNILLLAFSPGEGGDYLLEIDHEIREIQLAPTHVPVEIKVYPSLRINELLGSLN